MKGPSAESFFVSVTQHIRRAIDYDALVPSPAYTITAACIKAVGRLEGAGVIAAGTPFYAYAVFAPPKQQLHKPSGMAAVNNKLATTGERGVLVPFNMHLAG